MNIPLDEVIHFDVITSDADGAAVDADSTPTFACYEEATDTDIGIGGNFTKRTSLTGNYRGTFTLSAANGFEVGKWYSIIGSATVDAVAAKTVVKNFRVVAAEAIAGKVKADMDGILGTAVSTPATAGILDVNVKNIDNDAASASGTVTFPNATLASTTGAVGSVTGAVGSVTGAVGSVTGLTAATVHADLDDIQARLPAALTAGGNIKADMLALNGGTQSAADLKDFADDGYDPSTNKVTGVVLVDTLTTYTGNTVQTGDSFALIGATGSGLTSLATQASVNTIDDFLDTEIAAIKTKTDFLPSVTAGDAGGLFIAGTNATTTVNFTGTITTVTTATNVTTVNGMAANVITATSIASDAITAAKIATGAIDADALASDAAAEIATAVWQDATAGDFTVASSIGKSLYTGNVVPGAAGGHFIAGTNAATVVTTSFTTTFTGNLTGSVGSVTGAVGSVTGAVGSVTGAVGSVTGLTAATVHSDLDDIQARLPAALSSGGFMKADIETIKTNAVVNGGTVTFPTNATLASTTNITGGTLTTVTTATNVTTVNGLAAGVITATSIATDAITAAKIAADAIGTSEFSTATIAAIADQVWDEIMSGHVTAGSAGASQQAIHASAVNASAAIGATTFVLTTSVGADDKLNASTCHFISGTGANQAPAIVSDYVHSTKTVTLSSGLSAAIDTDTVVVFKPLGIVPMTATNVEDIVWDATTASHADAGSMGAALGAAGGGATPAAIATAVWQDATAGDFTTSGSIGKSLFTGGVVPGGTNGLFIAGSNAATTVNITGTITTVTTATNVTTVNGLAAGVITAAAIATGAIDADALAADAGTEIGTAVWATTTRILTAGTNIGVLSAAQTAAAVWDALLADYDTADTMGEAMAQAGGSGASAAEIANAVWNEVLATHTTADTPGLVLNMLTQDTVTMSSDVALGSIIGQMCDNGSAWTFNRTTDSLEAIRDAVTTVAEFVDTEITSIGSNTALILADTDILQQEWANGGRLDLLLDTAAAGGTTTVRVLKNTALAGFTFTMVDATDGFTLETGLTITATRAIDGAAFAACANAVSEISGGAYKINLAAADLNGDTILLRFAASGARTRHVLIITNP